MLRILFLSLFFSVNAMAAKCDCEVRVSHPTTASQKIQSAVMKAYTLESYDRLTPVAVEKCRKECLKEFQSDLQSDRLRALLITLSQKLIEQEVVGYNCTGLTTFKYPVRVKARLGSLSLGNVTERLEVVTHEEACF